MPKEALAGPVGMNLGKKSGRALSRVANWAQKRRPCCKTSLLSRPLLDENLSSYAWGTLTAQPSLLTANKVSSP